MRMPRQSKPVPIFTLDATTVLYRARRILWKLQADPSSRIDPTAVAAVTAGRWGPAGTAFADRVIGAIGAGAGEVELERAIVAALLKGE